MSTKKLKLEDLQIKGFITDVSSDKSKTHHYKGGFYSDWWGNGCGGGGGGGGTGPTLRCDDWTDEEGTRHCTDPEYCYTDYDCPTEWPEC